MNQIVKNEVAIDWSLAPKWANYATQGSNGVWWWSSNKPEMINPDDGTGLFFNGGEFEIFYPKLISKRASIEKQISASIDWNKLPKSAQFLAMDISGVWYWYQFKPSLLENGTWKRTKGRAMKCKQKLGYVVDFKNSLMKRP